MAEFTMNNLTALASSTLPALEVLVDIARTIGERRFTSGGDSRSDWRDMCSWADEFQAKFESNPDAGETYMEDIESFAIAKAVANGWTVFQDATKSTESLETVEGLQGYTVRMTNYIDLVALVDKFSITPVHRVRIDFKHPPIRTSSAPDGEDFEYEGEWRNRISSLMDEIHAVGNDADKLSSCEGIDVVGVDPYVIAEFSTLEHARVTASKICEVIVMRGGSIVPAEPILDDADEQLQQEQPQG